MLINQVKLGRIARREVCDAHPELLRAARNVGMVTTTMCPICESTPLKMVTYVFGHRLPPSGRCVSSARELDEVNRRSGGRLTAYVVEACTECQWHHLLRVLPLQEASGRRARG